jgi:hypothetical protein
MSDLWEDVADFMLSTMTGQWSVKQAKMNREQLIAHIRKAYPDEETLRAHVGRIAGRVGADLEMVRAQARQQREQATKRNN